MKIQGNPLPVELPKKKPDWFKIRFEQGERYQKISGLVQKHALATVCSEARCPNIYECWNSGTATFMLMGDTCTRACKFCHVNGGKPRALDSQEPEKLAESVKTLSLDYVVLTSVNRDDLEDEGAEHFARCVEKIKEERPGVLVETLTPDFRRTQSAAIARMLKAGVDVMAHNVETVRRLVPSVRDARCRHDISLEYHREVKRQAPHKVTKSSIMLGLGESFQEVEDCLQELREAQVEVVTLGQYLQPTKFHHPVVRYVPPSEFKALEQKAYELGFRFVASGPMVRSSYRAAEVFLQSEVRKRQLAQ
ncbi:MAG: lipoyl synthase [Bradymonadales bacterium]|nr:MAG: lipoyl synthase [Bradymonadales bacterium]